MNSSTSISWSGWYAGYLSINYSDYGLSDIEVLSVTATCTQNDGYLVYTGIPVSSNTEAKIRINAHSNSSWPIRITVIYKDAEVPKPGDITYLYDAGEEFEGITGGWQGLGTTRGNTSQFTAKSPAVTKEASHIHAILNNVGSSTLFSAGVLETKSLISLSGKKQITIEASAIEAFSGSATPSYLSLAFSSNVNFINPERTYDMVTTNATLQNYMDTFDISDLEGDYYVGIILSVVRNNAANYASIDLSKVYLS